jgi:hypothetical protein
MNTTFPVEKFRLMSKLNPECRELMCDEISVNKSLNAKKEPKPIANAEINPPGDVMSEWK